MRWADTFRNGQAFKLRTLVRIWERVPYVHRGTPEPARPSLPERKGLDQQWANLTHYLDDQNDRAQALVDVQSTAARHLDAAHYALDRIALELVDVMPSIKSVARIEPGNVVYFDLPVPPGLRSVEEIESAAA